LALANKLARIAWANDAWRGLSQACRDG